MAYDSTKPPSLAVALPGGGFVSGSTNTRGNMWVHSSTADSASTVAGASYFSNGAALGMRKYDILFHIDEGSTYLSVGLITSVTASSAATVTFGTLDSSA